MNDSYLVIAEGGGVETVRTIIDGCRRPQQQHEMRPFVKAEARMVAYHLPVMVEVLDEGERPFHGISSHCRAVEDRCG